ncbi:MAG: histidinol-phosphate transaminase [Pseudomonadota bacterium]
MTGPRPRSHLDQVALYKGGDAPKKAGGYKLSSNENPLGCAPAAREALLTTLDRLEVYPDGTCTALREAIGRTYGLDPVRIMVGAGSDEVFQLLGQAYLSPGDEVIQSASGFLVYRLVAEQAGAAVISAPETAYGADVDALLAAVTERTRLVFLANPNNPTGTYLSHEEVMRLHAGLPDHVLLVLDGAYAEYVAQNDYSGGFELAGSAPNVLTTRTFSKIHGLAALRVGWAYGPQSVIDALNKVRGPFNVSGPAQAAAVAAIEARDFVDQSARHNSAEMTRLVEALKPLGYAPVPSAANFVLLPLSGEDQVAALDAHLREQDIVVRRLDSYGLPHCLRISIGTTDANSALIDAMRAFGKAT